MASQPVFKLNGGEVRVWLEQEAIHMIACDLRSKDPTELTGEMARELAAELERLATILDD